jgi:hypothetical protein
MKRLGELVAEHRPGPTARIGAQAAWHAAKAPGTATAVLARKMAAKAILTNFISM